MDEIRQFYKDNPPTLKDISDIRFRHFRLRLPNGTFKKIEQKITDPIKLQSHLVRYRPTDVYYSVSKWLNPHLIGAKKKTELTQNLFLGSDIAFDIDKDPLTNENLDYAKAQTQKLIGFSKAQGLDIKYICFSGSKGFHILCEDPNIYDDPDPIVRENQAIDVRKRLVEKAEDEVIEFDTKITLDTRRIIRVPETINSKTGYLCTVLDEASLRLQAKELLKKIEKKSVSAPAIPHVGDDRKFHFRRTIKGWMDRFGARSHPTYVSYLSSKISGTKNQILILNLPKERDGNIQDLIQLQSRYMLSDIHLFDDGENLVAVSFDAFQDRRIEKILKSSNSKSLDTFLKYGQTYMRVGKRMNGGKMDDPLRYKGILPAKNKKQRFQSTPHVDFFEQNGLKLKKSENNIGKGQVFISHAQIV